LDFNQSNTSSVVKQQQKLISLQHFQRSK